MDAIHKILNQGTQLSQALTHCAEYIKNQQHLDGCIPWYAGQFADPWDHVEAAMGLTIGGHWEAAGNAYIWLADHQNLDGSWYSQYGEALATDHELLEPTLKQSHHVAYLAVGLWHYYLCTHDKKLLRDLFRCLEKALEFVLALQSDHGDIAWAVDAQKGPLDDALITAGSSVYKSLGSALNLCDLLDRDKPDWKIAYAKLGDALRNKPDRFDRHWQSKKRYSMDWFYPILSGVVDKQQARLLIKQRWPEFIIDDLGCLCVQDHPWVTTAETAELCLALINADMPTQAEQLLLQLLQFQDDSDGGFWTGYVYPDDALWPEEKTTWSAAAILLAADGLFQLTPGASIFTQHRPER